MEVLSKAQSRGDSAGPEARLVLPTWGGGRHMGGRPAKQVHSDFFFFFAALGFELKTSHLPVKHSYHLSHSTSPSQ
jgi:hypothetical protein